MKGKRFWLLSFVCVLILSFSCFGLIACKEEAHEHTYGDWTVTKEATCLEAGVETRVCLEDSTHTETRPISALGHSIVVDEASSTSATCLEAGSKVEKCERCDYTVTTTIPATGHSLSVDESASTLATCTTEGSKVEKCANCSYTVTTPIPATNHSLSVDESASTTATCTTAGVKVEKCSKCSFVATTKEPAKGHDLVVDNEISVKAGCTTFGKEVHKCKNCDYTEEVSIAPLGHDWDIPAQTCEQGQTCSECDATTLPLFHDYVYSEIKSTSLTCETDEVNVYVCSHCSDEISETIEFSLGHKVSLWKFVSEEVVSDKVCTYAQKYEGKCSTCSETVEKVDEIVRHSIKGLIGTFATCCSEGEKIYTCSNENCNYSYKEYYTDEEAHDWDDGVTEAGVTTYTCCNSSEHTHVVLSARTELSTEVDNGLLKDIGKVELQNATMSFDEKTLNGINGDIALGADVVSPSDVEGEVNLPEGIEDNAKIFNLTMSEGGNPVTNFNGKVTVKVPYSLGQDEDPDNIAIYYISEGDVVAIKAKYSNGYAIFETNHFSYYTVTRLSPADRCALYGHSYVTTKIEATCLTDGYTLKACQRCGNSIKTDLVKAFGHSIYLADHVANDCETAGYEKYKCSNLGCQYDSNKVLPATGHSFSETDRVEATCSSSGSATYVCLNENCDKEYVNILPQKKHLYVATVTNPTCVDLGYTEYKCSACNHEYVGNYVKANGHDYGKTVIAPTCDQEGYTLYQCKNCDSQYSAEKVNPEHVWDILEPTCGKGQKCLKCGIDGLSATGEHTLVNGVCSVCGEGCAHQDVTTVIAPTCSEGGYTLTKCEKCGAESKTDYKPATGHDGEFSCSICDKTLVEDGFFANLLTSAIDQNYAILIRDFKFNGFSKVEVSPLMSQSTYYSNYEIDFMELSLYLDDEGNLCGYGYGSVELIGENYRYVTSIEAVIEDEYLFVKYTSEDSYVTKDDTAYIRIPISELNEFGEYGQIIDLALGALKLIKTDILPFVVNAINNNKESIDNTLRPIIENLFKVSPTSNGYLLEFDFDALRSFNEILATKTVKEIYEMIFGEGEYDNLADDIIGIFDVKIGDVLGFVEDNGLDLDKLVDKVFEIIEKAGGYIPGVSEEDVKEYLNSDKIRGYTIKELLEKLDALEGFEEWKDDLEEALEEIADVNIYELLIDEGEVDIFDLDIEVETPEDFKDYVDGIIDKIENYFSFDLYLSANGELQSYEINLNYSDEDSEGGIKLDLEVISNYDAKHDYEAFLTEIKDLFDSAVFSSSNAGKIGEMTVTVNEDGTLNFTSESRFNYEDLYWYYNEENYDDEGNLVSSTYRADYVKYTYNTTVDLSKSIVTLAKDCGDNVYFYITLPESCYEIIRAEYSLVRYQDEITKEYSEPVIESIKTSKMNRPYSAYGVFNVKTGKIVSLDETTAHQYTVDVETSIEPINCGDRGEIHFSCALCGDTYIQFYYKEHENITTELTLVDGATSCEDGVVVAVKCLDCNEVIYSYTEYYHVTKETSIQIEECSHYGNSPEIYINQCACGQYSSWGLDRFENWNYIYDYETDTRFEYYVVCSGCNLMVITTEDYVRVDTCAEDKVTEISVVIGTVEFDEDTWTNYFDITEVLEERTLRERRTSHGNYITKVELLEGSETCLDGVKYYYTCLDCGYKSEEWEDDYHCDGAREIIDLSEQGDYEGYIIIYGCPCGYYGGYTELVGYYYNYRVEVEGYEDYAEVYFAKEGNTVIALASRSEKGEDSCLVTYYTDVLIGFDPYEGTYEKKLSVKEYSSYEHNEKITGVLSKGSDDCHDGVDLTATCMDCGNVRTYKEYYHASMIVKEINLHDLGVVCGTPESLPLEDAYAYLYRCPCGYREYYEIDFPCDAYVPETIYQTDSYNYLYLYKCAVTNPQCNFKYAVKSYVEKIEGEECLYNRYVDVYFGCDTNGANAQASFLKIHYGVVTIHSSRTYRTVNGTHPCERFYQEVCVECGYAFSSQSYYDHDYVELKEYVDEDGNFVIERNNCKVCGECETTILSADGNWETIIARSYIVKFVDNNSNNYTVYSNIKAYKYDVYVYQKAPDGIFDLRRVEHKYEFIEGPGYLRELLAKRFEGYEYVYNYDQEFSSIFTEFTGRKYSLTKDGCYTVIYEIDAEGNRVQLVGFGNSCSIPINWTVIKGATCTQFGDYCKICSRCKTIRMTGKIYPNFHDFDEYNEETGMWVCVDCGIENLNGANGMISLEECKDVLPDEDDIVVGYYMHQDIYGSYLDYDEQKNFDTYFMLSITLIDKEDPDNQILTDVFASRVDIEGNYVSFSLQDVIEYMTENGYSFDDFDVRLSFVPIGGESYLDYGITFTDLFD